MIALIQDLNIEDKIKNAPDSNYEIGVFIGSMVPFVVLVILAYIMYYYNKKNNQDLDL
ncbi:hypothetical protein ACJOV8_004640 [Formosa sp. 3Alg 14/1]|uniref:Uncharacterized protein n=1 Tax=Formosa agariphila (strain DSM 15362 / KCTC 12365 / LMG 23005 / KMM 3901 / M-2Alg 35-1) TaxID=1347342 RepID=T2KGB8_FORAG|nr:hypothetical protein [Formosa agariphila]CDF77770.1 conserved hypothetical protein [Formosa agariphila KMM 3901]